jgi:hypothetical protein
LFLAKHRETATKNRPSGRFVSLLWRVQKAKSPGLLFGALLRGLLEHARIHGFSHWVRNYKINDNAVICNWQFDKFNDYV